MPAPNTISIEKLIRLIGTPKCPALIDVRPEDAFDADPYLIPSSRHRPFERVSSEVPGSQSTVVICQEGTSLSQGVAAWLRTRGVLKCWTAGSKRGSKQSFHWFPFQSSHPLMLKVEPCG